MNLNIIFSLYFLGLSSAFAAEEKLNNFGNEISGNTLEVTNKFGHFPIYFSSNGTFQQKGGHNMIIEGRWRMKGDEVCSTVNETPERKNTKEFCLKIAGRKIGDQWTGEDSRNGEIKFKLIQGKSF